MFMPSRRPRSAFTLSFVASLATFLSLIPSASADSPFYYYPAYGAQRGRMVYRQGPFGGTRQKIHWGNGVTDNGVTVLHDAFAAAVPILTSVLNKEDRESDVDRDARNREHQRAVSDDRARLDEALALESRTRALLVAFGGTPDTSPLPQASAGSGDWDNGPGAGSGAAPATGTPQAGGGWDNGPGNAGGTPSPASSATDPKWDNRKP